MEHILNETPFKTTNGFKINNIKVDLNLPTNYNFHEYDKKISKDIKEKLDTKIGLSYDKYYDITIDNPDDIYTYDFTQDDNLIENMNINVNKKSSLVLIYKSMDENIHFHHLNLNIKCNDSLNLTIINLLNKVSNNFLSIEGEVLENGVLTTNIIDLGSNIKINRVEYNTLKNGISRLNNIYLGKDNNIIDLNYHLINKEEKSTNNIEVQGVLDDHAKKSFKGTIDFISGAKESVGEENENTVLLSDTCISKSLPMLMCGEENVIGAHGVSSGKLDKDKLFYITSRGLSISDATKLIINSNFGKILNEIDDLDIKNNLIDIINEMI